MAIPRNEFTNLAWKEMKELPNKSYMCAYCGNQIVSNEGYYANSDHTSFHNYAKIYICHNCHGPTVFTKSDSQYPLLPPGLPLNNIPEELNILYNEARLSAGEGAYDGAVLIARSILMHIAVEKGAEPEKPFSSYIEYLLEKGYISPEARDWVNYIKKRGNDASHRLDLMKKEDAHEIISLVEILMKSIYTFPHQLKSRVPQASKNETLKENMPSELLQKAVPVKETENKTLIGKLKDKWQ